ncbi:MAG: Clp protease ClpP [Verrucomicrobiae bacterium]|nr:Clp protease ClpP [Verrucomicrobiae bacterium]
MNWFSIIKKGGATTLHLIGEIGVGRPAEELIAELGDSRAVDLRVDSPGGSTGAGLMLYDALQGRQVTATITGRWGSAALLPVMAAQHIECVSTARVLVHGPSNFAFGTADDLRHAASVLDGLTARIEEIISRRTKQDPTTVRAWLTGDNYFSAVEALQMGLVDRIYAPQLIERPCPASKPNIESPTLENPPAPSDKTEAETMFAAWLEAFGPTQVRDREKFLQDLNLWALANVHTA